MLVVTAIWCIVCVLLISFLFQGLSNRTVENSRLIADVTSQTQNLTAPHVSIVSTVVEQLTSEASTNPEVGIYVFTFSKLNPPSIFGEFHLMICASMQSHCGQQEAFNILSDLCRKRALYH